jgi:hypothetical protein
MVLPHEGRNLSPNPAVKATNLRQVINNSEVADPTTSAAGDSSPSFGKLLELLLVWATNLERKSSHE